MNNSQARKLAEKIVNQLIVERCTGDGDFEKLVSKVSSLLIEAMEEVKQERCQDCYQRGLEEGVGLRLEAAKKIVGKKVRQEAFEEAAKIAEQRPTGAADDGLVVQSDIAATIRLRAKEITH